MSLNTTYCHPIAHLKVSEGSSTHRHQAQKENIQGQMALAGWWYRLEIHYSHHNFTLENADLGLIWDWLGLKSPNCTIPLHHLMEWNSYFPPWNVSASKVLFEPPKTLPVKRHRQVSLDQWLRLQDSFESLPWPCPRRQAWWKRIDDIYEHLSSICDACDW